MGTGMEHRRAARQTLDRPGFGVTRIGHELLIGVPEITRPRRRADQHPRGRRGDLCADRSRQGARRWPGSRSGSPWREIIVAYRGDARRRRAFDIPFAIGESALQPVALPQSAGAQPAGRRPSGLREDHGTCRPRAGDQPPGCPLSRRRSRSSIPKTSLIGKIGGPPCAAYAYTPDDIDQVLAELAGLLADRLPPAGLSQDELLSRTTWEGPHHFVLIDDEHELRSNPMLGKAGGDRTAVESHRAQPRDRSARHRRAAAGQLGRRLGDEPVPAEADRIPGADIVHGQRPADGQGVRPDQCPATAAGPGSAGEHRRGHRGCAGGYARRY